MTTADTNILAVENLSVTLDGVSILRDISFRVRAGEALAVIGPNGAGKTVLFRALLGLLRHEGQVRWRAGTRLGYVPQRFLIERSTPVTALEFCLLKSKHFWQPRKEFVARVREEVNRVGLSPAVLNANLGELSAGQTQRLLIAWALLEKPDVLLLDEPTAAVDAGFEETFYALVRRVQLDSGTTVLLISHDLSVVYRYAQNVVCLNKTVVCQGPPVEALHPDALASLYGEAGLHLHGPEFHG